MNFDWLDVEAKKFILQVSAQWEVFEILLNRKMHVEYTKTIGKTKEKIDWGKKDDSIDKNIILITIHNLLLWQQIYSRDTLIIQSLQRKGLHRISHICPKSTEWLLAFRLPKIVKFPNLNRAVSNLYFICIRHIATC